MESAEARLEIVASPDTHELAAAMAKAQGELHNPGLDKENSHFRHRFASLPKLLDLARAALAPHGLSVRQHPVRSNGEAGVITRLSHSSGQWEQSLFMLPVSKQDAHGVASAVTYARRYALQSLLGVAGEEDDDGNAAVVEQTAPPAPPPAKPKTRKANAMELVFRWCEASGIEPTSANVTATLALVASGLNIDTKRANPLTPGEWDRIRQHVKREMDAGVAVPVAPPTESGPGPEDDDIPF